MTFDGFIRCRKEMSFVFVVLSFVFAVLPVVFVFYQLFIFLIIIIVVVVVDLVLGHCVVLASGRGGDIVRGLRRPSGAASVCQNS